jgi:hypothetical protein
VGTREAVAAGTLRATDKGVAEVAARFDALMTFTSLRLGRRLGTEVTPLLSRKEMAEPALRAQSLVASLVSHGQMTGTIRIPDTVGPLVITVDLRAGRVTCHVDVDAPREGRPTTRVNWLIRQLKDAPDNVRVEAFVAHGRGSSAAELLRDVRANPAMIITDPSKELRSFRIAVSSPLGTKRSRGRGSFIESVLDAVDGFYSDVMQNLRAWTATPPKLRADGDRALVEEQGVAAPLVSTALSSQDGPQDMDATEPAHPQRHPADDTQEDSEVDVAHSEAQVGEPESASDLAPSMASEHSDSA